MDPVLLIFFQFIFMYMGILPECLSLHHIQAWSPQRLVEVFGSSGSRVKVVVNYLIWVLGTEPGSLQDQEVLLTVTSSL